MKQLAKRLALLMVLVFSLTVFQGCTESDQKQEESEPSVISRAEELENGDPSDAEQEPILAIPPEEDEDLIREILLLYGATCEEPDDAVMRTQKLSLYFVDEWAEPEELPPGAYFSWFLTTVWTEELTDEELEERYTLPDREGWAFPQEIYEARVQSRFDVSADHLRSDEALYHPDKGVYWLGFGGGIGVRPFVELRSVRREDDLLLFDIVLVSEVEFEQDEAWQLAVRLEEDGGWKYQSWVRTDEMQISAEDEAERLAAEDAAATEQARQQMESAAQQSTSNEDDDNTSQPSSSTDSSINETSSSPSNSGQGAMEEPTSGVGRERADRMGATWIPELEGWVFITRTGEYVLITYAGASRSLDGAGENLAIAKRYLG